LNLEKKKAAIIWLTGMSGSGKTTHSKYLDTFFQERGYFVRVLDGDAIRNNDKKQLGFGFQDVRSNNLRIASLCNDNRDKLDVIIVPVISPYDKIRKEVRKLLSPMFHLIYLKASIEALRYRDTKGLYAAADRGEIKDLIGYSKYNPYEIPTDAEIVINTGVDISVEESRQKLTDYINSIIVNINKNQ
jgi:adenylylsulfate kinase